MSSQASPFFPFKWRTFYSSFLLNKQVQNIVWSFVFRIGAIASNFLLVPLIINQLSELEYGILVTLMSITTWFTFIDFGLANGLKNKISENTASGNILNVKKYISTAYYTLFKVLFFLALALVIANFFINWNDVLKGPKPLEKAVNILFFYGLLCFFAKILIELINPVLLAYHKTGLSSFITFVSQVSILVICYFLKLNDDQSLVHYGMVFFFVPLVFFFLFSLYFYTGSFKDVRPSIKSIERKFEKSLLQLGGNFFIIQIAVLLIFTTDNLIIGRILGYDEVSKYNIAFRYFNIPVFILSVILTPYWPVFAELFIVKDGVRIKKIMKRLVWIWVGITALALLMLISANYVYNWWIGPQVAIPFLLNVGMFLFVVISSWNNVFVTFLNATSRLRLQIYAAVVAGVINIPLSIYLAKYTTLGAAGVIFSTCACLLLGSVWTPIQFFKLVNNRASGIWNK